MATYKNYSMGGMMSTSVCELGLSNGHSRNLHTIVDITVWSIGSSAGCAGNNGIAIRQGDETQYGGHHA